MLAAVSSALSYRVPAGSRCCLRVNGGGCKGKRDEGGKGGKKKSIDEKKRVEKKREKRGKERKREKKNEKKLEYVTFEMKTRAVVGGGYRDAPSTPESARCLNQDLAFRPAVHHSLSLIGPGTKCCSPPSSLLLIRYRIFLQ